MARLTYMPAFERLKSAVIARTGHAYYADKDKLLHERVRERMQAFGVPDLDAYVDLLEPAAGSGGQQRAETEWRALEDAITIGETYFFRYPDHFEALRTRILPQLIERRRPERQLRIWSIGCSTGAEPYSVAILIRELLGDELDSWRVSITGGDISERALAAARTGRYSAWALRTMGDEDRRRYFDRDGQFWILRPEYRRMVRFERQNLLDLVGGAPPLAWTGFDLVMCRNVLIYFSPEQAIRIAQALARCIAADGALLLGHVEATLTADPGMLLADGFTSEFGQALRQTPAPAQGPAAYEPLPLPELPQSLRYNPAPAEPQAQVSAPETVTLDSVRELADAGAYEEALARCAALIAASPVSARAHYLHAVLLQVADDPAGAEAALRKALYLDRKFTLAHHRLGALLHSLGRSDDAHRHFATAARLAAEAPADSQLAEGQGVTNGELAAALRALPLHAGGPA